MVGAVIVLWLAFNVMSNGLFLSPRNLWNLSVQSAAVAIMTSGMVLIIVSRNIDLSIGSIVGFTAMVMGLAQTEWIPNFLGPGFDPSFLWVAVVLLGVVVGAVIGGLQGYLVAYIGIPSFIVTLGGLLVWRGAAFQLAKGRTIAPLDSTFQLLGGGPTGSLGATLSWLVAVIAIIAIAYGLIASRRRRRHYGFQLRPLWADVFLGIAGSLAVGVAVLVANSYPWPVTLAQRYATENNIPIPPGGLQIPTGIAFPVLIGLGIAIVMSFLATRRRFGRYVYSIGGNPRRGAPRRNQHALDGHEDVHCDGHAGGDRGGRDVRPAECGHVGLGTGVELQVIAAAVIGGTSFSGGIGTIAGGVLGAVTMQSLSSGMVLIGVDTAWQDIVVGLVLVAAVGVDTVVRRHRT